MHLLAKIAWTFSGSGERLTDDGVDCRAPQANPARF
jgi:hypothetical protein